ncbi:hypothetical protein PC9H_006476 [Pleurotus ostreatus]|uniref:Uncharacterized protein n=1 Tax=Pleurotus ostreatus TaxID=5322 RepID=A0A8H6ZWR7_PLEOS|nr:uncharacterized protein PC9H_006476 [Pleurotus ostreatus]KAF7430765.1 hypothetical protein PC9H_006476 [Pleurotus ostreatus]KAJ8695113.1 hypothetical protein PTI98_007728 [Pleurotus ostreatus]
MPTAPNPPYSHPRKMPPSLIELHYNRGHPMSDLALHAAQYFRPRKLTTAHALMQNRSHSRSQSHSQSRSQDYREWYTGSAKRKVGGIPDEGSSATVSTRSTTRSTTNGPAPDTTAARPAKRQKVSTPAPANAPITLSASVEAMLARQALKADPMIYRRTRPAGVRVRAGSDSDATATPAAAAGDKGKTVGGGATANEESAIQGTNKEYGGAAQGPSGPSTKETPFRVRRAAEAPTRGPTTSFASPPKYRK